MEKEKEREKNPQAARSSTIWNPGSRWDHLGWKLHNWILATLQSEGQKETLCSSSFPWCCFYPWQRSQRQGEHTGAETVPLEPKLRLHHVWETEVSKTVSRYSDLAGRSACGARACRSDCGGLWGLSGWLLKSFRNPSLGRADGLRAPAARAAAEGLVRTRTLGLSLHEHGEENEIRPPDTNPYHHRQITQECKTKRRDSRINVHCCSEQKLNSKQ